MNYVYCIFLPSASNAIIKSSPVKSQGTAIALYSQCFGISSLTVPWLAGKLIDNFDTAFQLWLIVSLICMILITNCKNINKQISCRMTYTNEAVHKIISKNIKRSAMYSGSIQGVGPRYCPSIEDKIVKFADKEKHQIFLEPEGLNDNTIYPNGISTSLPEDVQQEICLGWSMY